MQSEAVPGALHAAIIMDGNGRWATQRGLPRLAGHHRGVEAIRRTAEACPDHGIGTLTLYAFSADNWQRPAEEVGGLMRLLRSYLRNETQRLARTGTRLSVVGRRDRLPDGIPQAIAAAEAATAGEPGCTCGSASTTRPATRSSRQPRASPARSRRARVSASWSPARCTAPRWMSTC